VSCREGGSDGPSEEDSTNVNEGCGRRKKKQPLYKKDFLFYKTFDVIVYQQASDDNDQSHTVII